MDTVKQLFEHRLKEVGEDMTRDQWFMWFDELLDEAEELHLL